MSERGELSLEQVRGVLRRQSSAPITFEKIKHLLGRDSFPPFFLDTRLTPCPSNQHRRGAQQMERDIKLCEELLAMDSFNVKGEPPRHPRPKPLRHLSHGIN